MVARWVSNIAVCGIVYTMSCLFHWHIGASTIGNLDVQHGVTLFEKYGPIPRIIIDLLMFPDKEAIYHQDINTAADDLSRELSNIFCSLWRLDFSSNISAEMFMVWPNTPQLWLPILYIPTPFLVSTLGIAISHHSAAQKYSLFTLLDSYPPLRNTAKWLFENYANVCFSGPNNISFHEYLSGNPNSSKFLPPMWWSQDQLHWKPFSRHSVSTGSLRNPTLMASMPSFSPIMLFGSYSLW